MIFSQESGFFDSKKKGSMIISTSFYNHLDKDIDLSSISDINIEIKLDYKFKSPLEIWVKSFHDKQNDIFINSLGLAYLMQTKKWSASVYLEKSFYNKDYNQNVLISSNHDFYINNGFILYFKNKIPFYLKYSNLYKKTNVDNSYDKLDKIRLGTYIPLNKLIFSISIDMNVRDFLNFDFNSTSYGSVIGLSLGYKIL